MGTPWIAYQIFRTEGALPFSPLRRHSKSPILHLPSQQDVSILCASSFNIESRGRIAYALGSRYSFRERRVGMRTPHSTARPELRNKTVRAQSSRERKNHPNK